MKELVKVVGVFLFATTLFVVNDGVQPVFSHLAYYEPLNCTEALKIRCFPCKPGFFADNNNTEECSCCQKLGLNGSCLDFSGNRCTSCPRGQYQDFAAQDSCKLCPEGSSQPQEGQIDCFPCDVGTQQPTKGQATCLPCSEGTYQPLKNQSNCHLCDVGQYQPKTGQPDCISCEAGSYSNSSGSVNCSLCEPGSYQSLKEQTRCLPCDAGNVCSNEGCANCLPCPPGTEAKTSGMVNCTQCEKGHAKTSDSAALCEPCEPGSYSDVVGLWRCKMCPEGFYCESGAFYPIKCQSYEVCHKGSGEPRECEPPWYRKVDESTCRYSNAFFAVISVTCTVAFIVIVFISCRMFRAGQRRVNGADIEETTRLLSSGNPNTAQSGPTYTGL